EHSKAGIIPNTATLSLGEVKAFTLTCATGVPSTNPPQLLLSNPNLAMIVSGGQTRPNASQVQIRGNMAGAETLFLWCNQPRGAFGGGGVVNTGVKAAINVTATTGKIDPNPITLTVGETKQVTLSCSTP